MLFKCIVELNRRISGKDYQRNNNGELIYNVKKRKRNIKRKKLGWKA